MGEAKDRISNLPDSILHHILSLLGIKVVARTSVLFHRWNYIWTSFPDLDFELDWGPNVDKFMNFVDWTLHRHSLSNNIQKFFVSSSKHLDESRLNSWISNVVKRHKVKELGLFLLQDHRLWIPLSVFTCASLTSLQLDIESNTDFPRYISLPSLKRLELVNMELSSECWNEEMFTNSPVLEELYLDNVYITMPCFCISIPTLKILRIDCYGQGYVLKSLKIHAPSLVAFYYSGDVAKEYVLTGFLTLAEAVVDLSYARLVKTDLQAIKQFLGALAHAYFGIIDYGSEDDGWTSLDLVDTGCLFRRLKSVCLKPCFWGAREISCVKVILRNAKALESLTIYHNDLRRISKLTEQELMLQIKSFPRASPSCTFKLVSLGNH